MAEGKIPALSKHTLSLRKVMPHKYQLILSDLDDFLRVLNDENFYLISASIRRRPHSLYKEDENISLKKSKKKTFFSLRILFFCNYAK